MKKSIVVLAALTLITAFQTVSAQDEAIIPVTAFRGAQATGITISENGRMFVNFPRWREGVPFSVVEVLADGTHRPYPDRVTNEWEVGQNVNRDKFICVQTVKAHGNNLYVLDTRNPLRKGTITVPTLFVYDLLTDKLIKTYPLATSTKSYSYVNDLQVDTKKNKIYLTDSGAPGLIVLDIPTGDNFRVLDDHRFTSAEREYIVVNGKKHEGKSHCGGIALDPKADILYFHALTGYTLYGVPTDQLISGNIDEANVFKMRTPAPDGMILDDKGNLYMGALENNAIVYITPDKSEIRILSSEGDISWPDTFTIHNGYLYYTNSRAHEVLDDVSDMEFTVNKIKLPEYTEL